MDLGIKNRVALVTGGARGIGLAVARRLTEEGCRVAVADANEVALAELPSGPLGLTCDVGSPSQLEATVRAVEQELGGIDVLVNNAGICGTKSLDEATLDEWEQTIQINLTSAFLLCRLVLPGMISRGWGRIVNVSSMAGKSGGRSSDAAYSASKAGLIALAKSVSREATPPVTSNSVAPAFIATDMTSRATTARYLELIPVGRLGTADEVAAAVAFLASDLAGFITGAVLDVNGGALMD